MTAAAPEGVELLGQRLAKLVIRRQALRQAGASPALLERNRLEIVRCQWRLSHALIERFLPRREETAA